MANRNVRRSARKKIEASVRIAWQDKSRTDKSVLTRCFDVSELGMRFELFERIPLRADVTLQCNKIGLQTRAVVRYCEQKGSKFSVGVEFASSYRWAPPNEEIRHALEEADMLAV